MARKSPAEKLKDLQQTVYAWERLRPNRSFFGLTLEQFKQLIQPSLDARAELDAIDRRRRIVIKKRDAADVRSFRARRGVVYAIQGDPAEGGNGELYTAMGFVPWSARGRPRLRKRRRGARR
jgi:hypothetical protein